MNYTRKIASSLLLVVALAAPFTVAACGVDGLIDCAQICERYSECVAEIDVTECTVQCEDRVDAAEDGNADACEECLDGANECDGVPECFADSSCQSVIVVTED